MIIANNKKAFFDYFIEEKYEAGIELKGSEVKSIKAGKVSIKESFVRIINDEIFIMGMSVVLGNLEVFIIQRKEELENYFYIERK
ncbi:Small protein B [Fusobacterium vincentii ATCC 49256]|uniref:Small protein B n=1 Tax=Fusobacterium vincentii ATCC 49256 TaxID=209882 RepID=Q7P475_FUSVC|nr:Small protein B [Fusobacterium vincentii ATCC 49256]